VNIKSTLTKAISKARGEEPPPPDALELIRSDHREVDALFATALADDTPSAQRRSTIAKITQALTVHAQMEEALFYPALRKAGGADERDSVLEAAEEHGVVKDLIAKIEAIRGRDETLIAKVTVLKELVHHHVKEEESEIFSEARSALGEERLASLGAEMLRFKQRALRGTTSKSSGERAAERGTPSAAPTAKKTATRPATAKRPAAKRPAAKRPAAKRPAAKRTGGRKRSRG
jgi:hemerythrin superfamily protein